LVLRICSADHLHTQHRPTRQHLDRTDLHGDAHLGIVFVNSAKVSPGLPTTDPNGANNTAKDPTAIPASLPSGGGNDPGPCGPASGGVRTCNLVAKPGSLTLPATGALPIWGFALDNGSPATVPGVTLVATEGETLQLNVRNALPAAPNNNLSVVLPAVPTSNPDSVGVPPPAPCCPNNVAHYTFSKLKPGVYVYEAGPTVNGARQVAMGLSGLLIVRPSTFNNTVPAAPNGTACNTAGASTTFTAEAMLAMNEFNRAFNANPLGASLNDYAPDVFLINGQAYPSTPTIPVGTGDCLMVHVADLGLREHSVGFLNLRQTVVSNDSTPLVHPQLSQPRSRIRRGRLRSVGRSTRQPVPLPRLRPPPAQRRRTGGRRDQQHRHEAGRHVGHGQGRG
jgi:hypothetical protein